MAIIFVLKGWHNLAEVILLWERIIFQGWSLFFDVITNQTTTGGAVCQKKLIFDYLQAYALEIDAEKECKDYQVVIDELFE